MGDEISGWLGFTNQECMAFQRRTTATQRFCRTVGRKGQCTVPRRVTTLIHYKCGSSKAFAWSGDDLALGRDGSAVRESQIRPGWPTKDMNEKGFKED